jgi:two-component system nitrogen regulation response regulator GlnG
MQTLLVIDDETHVFEAFQRNFESPALRVISASSGEEGLEKIVREAPDVVVMDIRLGGMDGLSVLKEIRGRDMRVPVIMMTAYSTTQTTIEAMKHGAFDYLLKPFDVPKMEEVIQAALKASRDMRVKISVAGEPDAGSEDIGIVGKSAAMQEVFKKIGLVSASHATVLVTGESGTGKELVARAIYQNGGRREKPFLAINCAAIPEDLLESELFGHEKGAFTSAVSQRIGKFEQCNGGTLFLDEIGDLPTSVQTKLLRVLQEGEFQRVGGNQTIKVDVRLIAATNKDLARMIEAKQFREDLYYRLNVLRIHLPPLRERKEDVPLLVKYFLNRLAAKSNCRARQISEAALQVICDYSWPGNVRELENIVQRATVHAAGDVILPKDIEWHSRAGVQTQQAPSLESALDALFDQALTDSQYKLMANVERYMIARALAKTGGNQVQAAKILGITRATLRKRVEKYKIKSKLEVE